MRGRLPLFVLLTSALVFLVSLYLPWQGTNQGTGGGVLELLDRFSTTSGPFDGWTTAGTAAALAAVALAFAAAVAIARPTLGRRLPIGVSAVALAYFAVGGVAERRALNNLLELAGHRRIQFHYTYGAYLALASVFVALLAAVALELAKPRVRPSLTEGTMALLALGVLVSLLLPWEQIAHYSFPAIGTASATLAALALFVGLAIRRNDARLAAAAAAALLTGATISLVSRGGSVAYGAWMALGFAVALVAVAALAARSALNVPRPTLVAACRTGAAILLLAALFMPWSTLGFNGWWSSTTPGSVAGGLAILVVAALGSPRLERYVVELSFGIAIFVTTLGFAVDSFAAIGGFAYGAYVGFAATAVLALLTLPGLRLRSPNRAPLPLQALALAASFVYLTIVIVAQWNVVPDSLQLEAPPLFTWLGVASVLLAIHLLASWVRRAAGSTSVADELVLIPLALLALVSLGTVVDRGAEPNWGLVFSLALGVVLVLLGWIEPRGGIARLRLPEALRVDRLPEAEG